MVGALRSCRAGLAVVVLLGTMAPVAAAGAAPLARQAAPSSSELFVRAAYRDLAGREPSASELGSTQQALASGTSRTQVAWGLTHGRDHAGEVVDRLYVRILGRAAEPGGRAFWVARLQSGVGVATLAAQLYGSREYFETTGSTPGSYVDGVYADLLGRPADASGRSYWMARVASGESRTVLARLLFLSRESNELRTVLMYLDLLRRPPEPSAQGYWAERLVRTDDLDVEARLVGSAEYRERAQDPEGLRQTRLTRGEDNSGDPEISGDGRLVVFYSFAQDLAPGPTSERSDVFLFDRVTGRFRNLSRGRGGGQGDISADGSTVVFTSRAALVPGDTNGVGDVFLFRPDGSPLQRLTAGNGYSLAPRVDGDGTTVVFTSTASDLVPGDTNGDVQDVFVHSQSAGGTTIERIGGNGRTSQPAISADGSTIAFLSAASDLVATDDDDDTSHLFLAPVPDPAGGPVVLISEAKPQMLDQQRPSLSGDGTMVAYDFLLESNRGGSVVTLGAEGIQRRQLDPGPAGEGERVTNLRVELSDDGTTTYQDQFTIGSSFPIARGVHRSESDSPGTVIGPHGSLTSDGLLVAADTAVLSTYGPPTQIVLWDLS